MAVPKRVAAAAVAGIVGLTGIGLASSVAPTATAASNDTEVASQAEVFKDALADLVKDGTITQEQADEVAEALDEADVLRGPDGPGRDGEGRDGEGRGGGFGDHRGGGFGDHRGGGPGGPGGHGGGMHGPGLDVAAEALGMTTDELREALDEEGTTLADVAEAQDVEVSKLVDALVKDATTRLNEAVEDERLTQDEADERIADLKERITEMVQEEPHQGRGPAGEGRDFRGDEDRPREGAEPAVLGI